MGSFELYSRQCSEEKRRLSESMGKRKMVLVDRFCQRCKSKGKGNVRMRKTTQVCGYKELYKCTECGALE